MRIIASSSLTSCLQTHQLLAKRRLWECLRFHFTQSYQFPYFLACDIRLNAFRSPSFWRQVIKDKESRMKCSTSFHLFSFQRNARYYDLSSTSWELSQKKKKKEVKYLYMYIHFLLGNADLLKFKSSAGLTVLTEALRSSLEWLITK